MKHRPSAFLRAVTRCLLVLGVLSALLPAMANGRLVPHAEVRYAYTLDFLAPGPQQGDPGQPRSDVAAWMGDATGDELADGLVPDWAEENLVGFTEYHGTGAGADNGLPQPRLEFDLGGPRALASISISYVTGGGGGVLGPKWVEIRVSRDGGITYPDLADVVYLGFDRTWDGTTTAVADAIPLEASGATHVRLDFYQDSHPTSWNTSLWVFLGEVTFYEGADTDADGISDAGDNCLEAYNPDQSDLDGDGLGDVCDPNPGDDDDLDLCLDDLEACGNDLGFCEAGLDEVTGLLESCDGDLEDCAAALRGCSIDLDACDGRLAGALAQLDEADAGLAEILRLLALPRGQRSSAFTCSGPLCPRILRTIAMLLDPPGQNHEQKPPRKGKHR